MSLNFNEATDALTSKLGHEEIAAELGVSVAAVRQARMASDAKGHRPAPTGWTEALARIAERRATYLRELAAQLTGRRPND